MSAKNSSGIISVRMSNTRPAIPSALSPVDTPDVSSKCVNQFGEGQVKLTTCTHVVASGYEVCTCINNTFHSILISNFYIRKCNVHYALLTVIYYPVH